MAPPILAPDKPPKESFSHQAFVWGAVITFFALVVVLFAMMAYASGPSLNSPLPTPSAVNAAGVSSVALTAPQETLTDGGLVFTSPTSGEAGPIFWQESTKKLFFGNTSGAYVCMGTSVDCTGGATGEFGGGYASFSNYLIPGGGLMFAPLFISSSENGPMLNNGGYLFLDNSIPAGWLHEDGTSGELFLQTGFGRAGGTPSGTGYLFDSYAAYSGTIAQFDVHGVAEASINSSGIFFSGTLPVPVVLGQSVAAAIEYGTQALTAGGATVTFGTAFSTTPVICTCTDNNVTTPTAVGCTANATALILKGTSTDTIDWVCIGKK
jgi:hypothetical protein